MFLIQAVASQQNERHEAGSKRSILIFAKQDEEASDEPNFALCEAIAKNTGWQQIEFKGAMPATPESVRSIQKKPEPAVMHAYQDAFTKGFGVLVFGAGS